MDTTGILYQCATIVATVFVIFYLHAPLFFNTIFMTQGELYGIFGHL